MNLEKSCGAIIFRKDKENLNFLTVKNKTNNYFGFPKGRMERNESEEETAIREVLEETGLIINLLPNFKTKTNYKLDNETLKEVTYFIGTSSNYNVSIQEEEISEFQWLSYIDTLNLLSFESDKDVLIKTYNFLKSLK